MNVALFFTYGVTLKDWLDSGLLVREIEIYEQIANNSEIKFTFITYGTEEDLKIINNKDHITILPIGKYLKNSNKVNYFFKSLIVPFKIKDNLKDIDLYKTNQLMGSWIPIILKFLMKKPLIIRTGYDIFDFSIKERKSFLKRVFYYLLTYLSLAFSDKYFVSSNTDLNNLKKRFKFIKKNKLSLKPNWVNVQESNKLFEDRIENRVLCIGRIESQKNYANLIKSLKNSEIEIDIVGEGSLKKEIANVAYKHKVKVNFLGILNHNKLLDLIENYKYFVLYSKFEGHPKSLIETMSKGCIPLVLSNTNILEVIEHKNNGIVLKNEKDSITNWINYLNQNKKEAKNLSLKAEKFVEDNFSLSNFIKEEIEEYNQLIIK